MRALVVAVALLACSKKAPVATADDAAPTKAHVAVPKGFLYAESTTGEAFTADGALVVWLARDGVRMKPDAAPLIPLEDPVKDFAAEHKLSGEHDLRLPALSQQVHGETRALVHVDRRVGFRVLTEVLFTLGQEKVSRWTFVLADGKGIELVGRTWTKPRALPSAGAPITLGFTVIVASADFVVKARGGTLAPDCKTIAPGITITGHDVAALRRCAVTALAGGSDRESTVAANPDIPFQTLVSTWDALRRRDDGSPLLPEIALGLMH